MLCCSDIAVSASMSQYTPYRGKFRLESEF